MSCKRKHDGTLVIRGWAQLPFELWKLIGGHCDEFHHLILSLVNRRFRAAFAVRFRLKALPLRDKHTAHIGGWLLARGWTIPPAVYWRCAASLPVSKFTLALQRYRWNNHSVIKCAYVDILRYARDDHVRRIQMMANTNKLAMTMVVFCEALAVSVEAARAFEQFHVGDCEYDELFDVALERDCPERALYVCDLQERHTSIFSTSPTYIVRTIDRALKCGARLIVHALCRKYAPCCLGSYELLSTEEFRTLEVAITNESCFNTKWYYALISMAKRCFGYQLQTLYERLYSESPSAPFTSANLYELVARAPGSAQTKGMRFEWIYRNWPSIPLNGSGLVRPLLACDTDDDDTALEWLRLRTGYVPSIEDFLCLLVQYRRKAITRRLYWFLCLHGITFPPGTVEITAKHLDNSFAAREILMRLAAMQ